jgi:hypothetical protein
LVLTAIGIALLGLYWMLVGRAIGPQPSTRRL